MLGTSIVICFLVNAFEYMWLLWLTGKHCPIRQTYQSAGQWFDEVEQWKIALHWFHPSFIGLAETPFVHRVDHHQQTYPLQCYRTPWLYMYMCRLHWLQCLGYLAYFYTAIKFQRTLIVCRVVKWLDLKPPRFEIMFLCST